ncbi:MAG: hypothetical protein AAF431_11285 [Pseudomonadota bacterium]
MAGHQDKLFGEFQAERNSFRKFTLIALLLVVFFLLVYQPYLVLLTEISDGEKAKPTLEANLKEVKSELKQAITAHDRAVDFMGDASEYDALYDDAENWINDLDDVELMFDQQTRRVRAFYDSFDDELKAQWEFGNKPSDAVLNSLKRDAAEFMDRYFMNDACDFLIEADWLNCELGEKRQPITKKLERVFYDRTAGHEHTKKLELEINEVREQFKTQRTERIASGELVGWFQESLEAEKQTIRKWYVDMARLRLDLNKRYEEYEQNLQQHNEWLESLEKRKQEISLAGNLSTPLGPIKLAFHDLLSLFPLFTFGLFALMLFSQRRQTVLRDVYLEHVEKDKNDDDMIGHVMPIAVDHQYKTWRRNILILALFATPPVIALASWMQLRSHPAFKLVGLTINQPITSTATAIAALVFIYLFLSLLVKTIKRMST